MYDLSPNLFISVNLRTYYVENLVLKLLELQLVELKETEEKSLKESEKLEKEILEVQELKVIDLLLSCIRLFYAFLIPFKFSV